MKCKCCQKEFEKLPFTNCYSSECLQNDFWDNALDNDAVIINGNCYHISPDDEPDCGFLGHDGIEFKIQFNDGRVVVTHNLWHNGKIPRERNIHNNAKFI